MISAVPTDVHYILSDLCAYTTSLERENGDLKRKIHDARNSSNDGPDPKRRKLEDGGANGSTSSTAQDLPARAHLASGASWMKNTLIFDAGDVSAVLPVRKRFKLKIGNSKGGGLSLESLTGKTEERLVLLWADIDQAFSLPVPEASKPAHYFVFFPVLGAQISYTGAAEPVIFSVPDAKPKDAPADGRDEDQEAMFRRLMDEQLTHWGKGVILPDAAEFSSALVQAHRKGEKAWHVKAFRGSKEGFLYLLPTGIFFGFRKPVLFFPLHSITSISYSSILQRTFNLNLSARLSRDDSTCFILEAGKGEEEADFEFSMLDQADYDGLNRYVRAHGLHDASLADQRRAKYYNVNKERGDRKGPSEGLANGRGNEGGEGAGKGFGRYEGVEGQEESELAKAERELQDREDEEEEDYDPSGGESEGSGSESEQEEEGDEDVIGGNDIEEEEGAEEDL